MSHTRRKYDPEFRAGAVRIVRETRRPVVEIARDLGIGAGTLGNWVRKDRIERVGAGNSAVVVDLSLCGPMLSPRVPHHVPIPGSRMERETPGQHPRPNYGHPHARIAGHTGRAPLRRSWRCQSAAARHDATTATSGARQRSSARVAAHQKLPSP